MKLVKYLIGASVSIFILVLVYSFIYADGPTRGCVLSRDKLTISTITYGFFHETIPQTGKIVRKDGKLILHVEIDELYLSRISKGLGASGTIDNKDYGLKISEVYPDIKNGRFNVDMNFNEQISDSLVNNKVRLRIGLSDPSNELLVPVGGFYKDTGGEWIFLKEGNNAVKRKIKLGRKSPDYFEVIEGLKEGDRVITSSYELFGDVESMDLLKMKQQFESNDSFLLPWL